MWPTASFCVHQISITGKKVRSNFIRYFMQCSESVTSTINEQRHLAGRRIEYDTDTSSPILWWPIKFYGDSILLPILNGSQSIEEKRQTETYRPSAEYNQRIALLRIFMMCWLVQIKYPNINRKYATVASALDSLVFPIVMISLNYLCHVDWMIVRRAPKGILCLFVPILKVC